MKEINRFYIMGNKLPSDDGSIVSYKDHAAIVAAKDARIAALQEQVRVLAAENLVIKSSVPSLKDIEFDNENMDDVSLGEDIGFNEAVELMKKCLGQTPATDATLREIRAQAVEGFSEFCGDNSVFIQATCNYDSLTDAACIYLARISAGDKP